jgi:hypothetical protein
MITIWHHFQEGGWAMYPIFFIGLIAAGAAARFAWRGEHQLLGFIRWGIGATLSAGAFGFVVEMMRVLTASQSPDDPMLMARIVMEGSTEAANNPATALMFTVMVSVLVAVGQRRFPLPNPSAVAR